MPKKLTDLPPYAVVIDGDGYAWQNGGHVLRDMWYRCLPGAETLSSEELSDRGPLVETVTDKTKRKHKKPRGLIHTCKPHYDTFHVLEDLAPGDVVVDTDGAAYQKWIGPGYWYSEYSDVPLDPHALAFHYPVTVLVPGKEVSL